MKKKSFKKIITKINFSTIFFFLLSLISTTFAWVAYRNVIKSNMEVSLKSWNVAITEGSENVSNNLSITVSDFRPGNADVTKELEIVNNGDLPAILNFEIESLRIFDEDITITSQNDILSMLNEDYPFIFNFIYDTNYIPPQGSAHFNAVISWPLDSGDDIEDGLWGKRAYDFYKTEEEKQDEDPDYIIRSAIELNIKLDITQYIDENASDNNYRYLSQIENNSVIGYVIEPDNQINTPNVKLLKSFDETPSTYNVTLAPNYLSLEDVISLVSIDIYGSKYINPGISDKVIGVVRTQDDLDRIKTKFINSNGTIAFSKTIFYIFDSPNCIWLKETVDDTHAYALKREGSNIIIYKELKTNTCLNSFTYIENKNTNE